VRQSTADRAPATNEPFEAAARSGNDPFVQIRLSDLLALKGAPQVAAAPPAPPPAPERAPVPPEYLTTKQAAALLGVSAKGLEAMRARGEGPAFIRVGRRVRYLASELGQRSGLRALTGAPPVAAPAVPAHTRESEYLPTKETAALLAVSPRGLEALRARGEGPPFIRVGNRVRYLASELGQRKPRG
jgi:hypothetical protein